MVAGGWGFRMSDLNLGLGVCLFLVRAPAASYRRWFVCSFWFVVLLPVRVVAWGGIVRVGGSGGGFGWGCWSLFENCTVDASILSLWSSC
jgi:hypothetical protein